MTDEKPIITRQELDRRITATIADALEEGADNDVLDAAMRFHGEGVYEISEATRQARQDVQAARKAGTLA